jgi:hypothetical protein
MTGFHVIVSESLALSSTSTINVKLTLPTVGFVKRLYADGGLHFPPSDKSAAGILYNDLTPAFMRTCNVEVQYLKMLSAMTGLSVKYNFEYVTNMDGPTLRLYANEIVLGFSFFLQKR